MKWIIYISLFLLTLNSFGQFAEADFSRNQILIGEQIEMTLKLSAPSDAEIQWPLINDTLRKEIEILERTKIDSQQVEGNVIQYSQKYTLTSFDSGFYAINPFVFLVNQQAVETRAYLIEVATMQLDTSNKITDIKQPISVEYSFIDWLKTEGPTYGIIALIAILLGMVIYFILKRKKPEIVEVVKEKPRDPAHIIAIRRLEILQQKNLWQSGKTKEYYSVLSEIIREYIEYRYFVNALEQTTDEIMHNLRVASITEEQKEKLRQFLFLSDMVKFAKEQPLPTDNERCFTLCYEFVELTKQLKAESSDEENQLEKKDLKDEVNPID